MEREIPLSSDITIKYEGIKKIVDQMEKCICQVRLNQQCLTGFFCLIPFIDKNKKLPVLITMNYFTKDKLLFQKDDKLQIIINKGEYMNLIDSDDKMKYVINQNQDNIETEIKYIYLKNRLIHSSEKYKTIIIEIKEEDDIQNYLELDDIIIDDILNNNKYFSFIKYINEMIYIIQYPPHELSVSYGLFDKKNEELYNFIFRCRIRSGGYGSPILGKNNKLIGILSGTNNKNENGIGTFLNFPIKEFIKINYNKIGKESSDEMNINIINDDLIDEFDKEKHLDIKNNKIEILDLSRENIRSEELKELSQMEFIKLKELYLNNNRISDIIEMQKVYIPKLEILNLGYNKISNINSLEKFYFKELKILNLYENNISNIKSLEKVNFDKLESLNLGGNKISDINILEKVNFKELKYLNLFDNEISDIQILEKVNFAKIEFLNLGANKISDINILERVNFKQLKILYLQINRITDIKVFNKVKFEKLELLNLCENDIDERENNAIISKMKSHIKYCKINHNENRYSFPIYLGMILDISNDILEKLIKFDKTKSFFENFCSEFNGEIMALINGNNNRPYYNLNNILLTTTNYLSDIVF